MSFPMNIPSATRRRGRAGRRRRERRGVVLVLFAMLTFVVLAIAALTIDLGMARLTQLEMQGAVNSAALEGLRFRDNNPWDPATVSAQGTTVGAQELDTDRRQAASAVVTQIFTDDTVNGITFGAGPVVQLSGGVGDPSLAAAKSFQISSQPDQNFYKPSRSDGTPGLELNAGYPQPINGDMVSGNYGSMSASNTAAGVPVAEGTNYSRADFQPDPAGESPGSSTYVANNGAFLVRMRRTISTNFPSGLSGVDLESGVSSSGPTVPLLFGLGSVIQQQSGAT